jgi:hypothetical protein
MMLFVLIALGLVLIVGYTAFFGAPYVPSHAKQVERAFGELRPLTASDVVVDLGSGDGVVLRTALQMGASKAIGFEIHPILVGISRLASARYGSRISVKTTNMRSAKPPKGVTVVYVFSVGRDLKRLSVLMQQWANSEQRTIECILYGHTFLGEAPVRTVGAHSLYAFTPLQSV